MFCIDTGGNIYILKCVDGSFVFGYGLYCDFCGVYGRVFVFCMFCEIGVMSWGVIFM